MRYFLPPPEETRLRELGAVRGIHGLERPGERGRREAPAEDGRLIRTSTTSAAEARAHLASWESAGSAREIPAPAGVRALERSFADRVQPGAMRRQRLAIAVQGDAATVVHWSVPEPPTPADERAWARVMERLGGSASRGGWSA